MRHKREREQHGIPPIAEALGYVGGALALAAVGALLASYWPRIGLVGHLSVGVALAVAGLLGGYLLGRRENASLQRLSRFLYVVGVAGVGFAAGFGVYDVVWERLARTVSISAARVEAAEWGRFAGAAALALSAGVVWWRERSVLQHLAFGVGVAGASLLVLPLMPPGGPEWGVGATLLGVAVVWGALSLAGLLPPRTAGLVLAALGAFGAFELMVYLPSPQLPALLFVSAAVCAALVWLGAHLDEMGVLGIGALGLTVVSAQIVGEYLGFGVGTAFALVAIGFVLLGACIYLTRGLSTDSGRNRRVVAEVSGYLGIALAMGGAGILFAQWWDELGDIGRVIVPLVGSVVGYGSGWMLAREESLTARRLSQTLFGIGVLAAGITAAMVARPFIMDAYAARLAGSPYLDATANSWIMLAGTLTATAAGAVTWWLRRGAITQAALLAALWMSLVAWTNFMVPQGQEMRSLTPTWIVGAVMVGLGVCWVTLGLAERLSPVRTALAGGCLVALQGLMMMTDSGPDGYNMWAGLLGIAVSIVAIGTSIYAKRAILLGFGAIGTIIFSVSLVMEVFGGQAAAPVLLLVVGIVMIATAVIATRIMPGLKRGPKPPRQTPAAPSADPAVR